MDKINQLVENVEEINAMPEIALDLMGLINDPKTTITDLVKKVKLDEALAAFILKNCNSPLYGVRTEIHSINQALTLLGFSTIRSILTSYFNKNLYSISGKSEIKKQLWLHSVTVASFSQSIAEHLKLDSEEAYLAGLLHDIGKLIIYSAHTTEYEKILKQFGESDSTSCEIEEKQLGYTHSEVGARVMKKWNFLDSLIEAARFHHNEQHFDSANGNIGVVAFADQVTKHLIDKKEINLNRFIQKYRLNEQHFEKIIERGIELKESYLEF